MAGFDDRERVFVYGTLRRGGSRDATIFYPGAEFLAAARVRGTLIDLGAYPGIRLDPTGGWVAGEILTVSPAAFAGLDEWEGWSADDPHGGEYEKCQVTVERIGGPPETCWIYELRASVAAGRPVIASGDWLAREW